MAEKLQKYKYGNATSAPRPARNTRQRTPDSQVQSSPTRSESPDMATEELKADILSSLRREFSTVVREELKKALAEDFDTLKSELQAVRSEIKNNMAAIRSEVDNIKAEMCDVQGGLSSWSDEVVALQTMVTNLQSQVTTLKD